MEVVYRHWPVLWLRRDFHGVVCMELAKGRYGSDSSVDGLQKSCVD